ncbi:Spc98 family-domain-containing protein [Cyathus striatus]|nr:Spc98 family-domain-containing protein [Cyathus striatus]
MIAEILLLLAGHSSSLFPKDHTLNPSFAPLLHPGEQQCLESLGLIAFRYRKIKLACNDLSRSKSRYVAALCSTLMHILKEDYEARVIETEAKILGRDSELVANAAFVPLSSIRAVFSEWDAPFATLVNLMDDLQAKKWKPGPLIDMLIIRSQTGIHRVADIISRISIAVQHVWRTHLAAFLVHGSQSLEEPFTSDDYSLLNGSLPSCISSQSRESIIYVGRAVGTIKSAKWQKQIPRSMATKHTQLLEEVLPEDQHAFDLVISQIRTNLGEWLWHNVLTGEDVKDAVDSLGNYFLLRNGEFSLSLIREIERLKVSRLTSRSGPASMIREQDLNLAILRASLGTTAQQDPTLSRLRFTLPSGPLRPLLPSLANTTPQTSIQSSISCPHVSEHSPFSSNLLGTSLSLSYTISWPLDLFLDKGDLLAYGSLFSFLSALRKTHVRIHSCWTSLSNAQRARRRWTGLGEGGTQEDLEARSRLLRCGWGIVRDMGWFLDTLLGYVMMDVVDVEFRKLKERLDTETFDGNVVKEPHSHSAHVVGASSYLDFTTLRMMHTAYLERLLNGCLLTNSELTHSIQSLLEVCERFAAQVERWGGDVLPALLFEGSLKGEDQEVGAMVKERWKIVAEIQTVLHECFVSFYDQLSLSTSQQLASVTDPSKSVFTNASFVNHTFYNVSKTGRNSDGSEVDSRRHVERLLLRLDFNEGLSRLQTTQRDIKFHFDGGS